MESDVYQQFRQEFTLNLMLSEDLKELTPEETKAILLSLDKTAYNYDILNKETALTTADYYPKELEYYLTSRMVEEYKVDTLKNYAYILRIFFNFTRKTIQNITTEDVRIFLYSYQKLKERPISNRTLNTYRIYLNAFFNWLVDEDYLTKNPCKRIKAIKYEKSLRSFLTRDQLEDFREVAETDLLNATIVEFLYSTGCRVAELCRVKKFDISWDKGEVKLFGKGDKERISFISPRCKKMLEKYLASRKDKSDFLFVTSRGAAQLSTHAVQDRFKTMSNVFQEKYDVVVTPHVLRHTFATHALQSGMPVDVIQKILGHVNISTTMIYAETDLAQAKNYHTHCIN